MRAIILRGAAVWFAVVGISAVLTIRFGEPLRLLSLFKLALLLMKRTTLSGHVDVGAPSGEAVP